MTNSTLDIDIGSLTPYEIKYFPGGSGEITCATPFWSPPIEDEAFKRKFSKHRREIWIDNNILSSAGDEILHENIVSLANWSKSEDIPISLTMAIYEKYRTNSGDPIKHILKSVVSLRDKYDIKIDEPDVRRKCRNIASRTAHHRDFEILTNSVIFFRDIFNMKTDFEEKCRMMAEYMSKYLVPSISVFLIAALFFYLDEHPDEFRPIRRKLRKDFKISGDVGVDRKRAHNIASDIGLFTYAAWPRFDFGESDFPVISIATCDTVLALLLEQLCNCSLQIENGINRQTPAYRKGSLADEKLSGVVKPLIKKFRECDQSQPQQRVDNATRVSNLILAGKSPLKLSQ